MVYPHPTIDSPVKLTPLSILYPGVLWEKQGFSVQYWDERYDSMEMLTDLIKHSNEIAVSAMTGYQCGRAAEILEMAKAIKPSIVTAVGGHHARLLSEQVLNESFVDKIYPEAHYGEDLFPYNGHTKVHFQRTEMQYMTSSGCPHNCSFCCLNEEWRPKDIRQLEYELKTMHEDIGFDAISFSDPNICFGKSHAERIDRIKKIGKITRDIGIKWDGNLRSPYLVPEMVDALEESNCCSIEIGCESGNDWFLKNIIKKGHGIDTIMQAATNIRNSGISIMYSFMSHMPRETPEMLADTLNLIDWIVDADPKARISIYNYAPYPGSKMYDDAINGIGYKKFEPPTTMRGWAELPLMKSPLYWIAGLCFRQDNSRKNFQGDDWKLIEPYIELAKNKWEKRDIEEFPCEEVEELMRRNFK